MRTTLKRRIGQAAAADGNGRPVFPPAVPTPMRRYRQPAMRGRGLRLVGTIVFWFLAIVAMLASAFLGGVYLRFHYAVEDLKAGAPELRSAEKRLIAPLPGKPTIALVVGYDRRAGEQGMPSRSDTIMLLRADPGAKAISMLSFPRDLVVEIHCPNKPPFLDRINAAYAECPGAEGTLETVRHLTNLDINYLITVNFRGFKHVVNHVGGVWIDVDRRYFNDNAGRAPGYTYATIDLQPGYQKLNGSDALDYVRYRHLDNDLYRNARQQAFVRAFKDQVKHEFSLWSLNKIVGAVVDNVDIGKGGDRELSPREVLSYARLAYELPAGHVFQSKIENLSEDGAYLHASPTAIQEAVSEFVNPDVDAPEEEASVVLGRKVKRKRAPPPRRVTVTVLNGNGVPGAAANTRGLLAQRGYRTLVPPNNLPADAPRKDYARTEIYFDPTQPGSDEAARELANLFGAANVSRGIPRRLRLLSSNAMNLVVVGRTFEGQLAPSPAERARRRKPPEITRASAETLAAVRRRQRQVPFPLMLPTVIEKSSSLDREVPIRVYRFGKHRTVRLTFLMGSELAGYWGIQQTDWDEAPVLEGRSFRHVLKDGRTYDFHWSGPHLRMVVLRANGASYWVVNTLLNSLSNETMVAIAKGLRPVRRAAARAGRK